MGRRRISRAAALLLLGTAAGLATCHLVPASGGSLAEHLAIQSLGLEIVLAAIALAVASLSRMPLGDRLGLGPSRVPAHLLLVLVVGAVAVSHGLDGVLELTGLREQSSLASFDFTLAGAQGRALVLALVGIGLAPGVAEELLCRGLVQRGLDARLRPAASVPLAAAFFGALHLDPVHAVFAAVLGLYLGVAAWLAGSIRAAIACHTVNNLLAVAVAARWPYLDVASPASTALGFALAAGCLWWVDRRAAAARLQGSRGGGAAPGVDPALQPAPRPADRLRGPVPGAADSNPPRRGGSGHPTAGVHTP
jgi:membrane protease YdiL (CAAX protease family)